MTSPVPGPLAARELAALVERLRSAIRRRHFSAHTLRAYEAWVHRYVLFHDRRDPGHLGAAEVRQFLDHTTRRGRASPSTRNQALSALLFLYRDVLERDLAADRALLPRAKLSSRVPLVLARSEIEAILQRLHGPCRLVVAVLYGSGLRVSECSTARSRRRLRPRRIIVRRQGGKDPVTPSEPPYPVSTSAASAGIRPPRPGRRFRSVTWRRHRSPPAHQPRVAMAMGFSGRNGSPRPGDGRAATDIPRRAHRPS
jgi:integrase